MYRKIASRIAAAALVILFALAGPISSVSAHFQAFSCADVSEIPQAECQALVALYNSTDGANWNSKTNWLTTNTPSNWSRVSVTNGHVTALNMDYNRLVGTIPGELGVLTYVTRLSLRGNELHGRIPVELGNMTSLQILLLSSNDLSGPSDLIDQIPAELGKLTNLVTLDLSENDLGGSIPAELGNLTHLKELGLGDNRLSGSIPAQLANLTLLERLGLTRNQLSGSIPAWLGNLTHLNMLDLGENNLSGGLPTQLGSLTNLIGLYLYSNPLLSGSIPTSFTGLTQLADFNFSNTGLCEPTSEAFQTWKAGVATWSGTSACLSISGKVRDPEGQGLAGVWVSTQVGAQPGLVLASSVITDASGNYTVSDIAPGVYWLHFAKAGYLFAPVMVELTTESLTGQDVTAALPAAQVYLPMLMGVQ